MKKNIRLQILDGSYAISRLDVTCAIPAWADGEGLVSISRGGDELSIVCLQERVPSGVVSQGEWTAIQFIGPFAFDETGIVLSVVQPLSEGGIGVFVISTYDGDHMLLQTGALLNSCCMLVIFCCLFH
ncbi:ACT domain-containing protein [uncultured Legionella sp.]|uniref:ACT domain-containing protein n=1 Tax=uncultured Legionella sp. TaxID=210934 RepID=UPI00262A92DF|nr:ACT domain-containing protein [uncultured Legionella sp.]